MSREARGRLAALIAAALVATGAAAPAQAQRAPDCPPEVRAPSAIVIEESTGIVACARNPDDRRSIASTTKLMTALLTLERAKLSDRLTAADYFPSPIESQIGLDPGEEMSVRDLMRGLLVESGNDAAVTLAEGIAGSRRAFVRAMNRRARQLELENTRYANPVGLDERGNHSSARDLVRLATVLRENRFFRTVVDRPTVRLTSGNRERRFANRNDLIARYSWVNGVKSGRTRQAGYVLVGSGRDRRGVQVISAVLGTPSEAARDEATMALLRFGLERFQRITAVKGGTELDRVPIRYRRGAELSLVAGESAFQVVPRGRRDDVTTRVVGGPDEVEGPIAAGRAFGRVEVIYRGEVVGRVPLVAASSVPAADFGQKAKSWFTGPLPLLLAFAVLAGTVLIGRQLRRTLRDGRRGGEEARTA